METLVRDDLENISFGAEPEPYLFEPEYTEDELLQHERQESLESVAEQSMAEERRRADSNWWCKCGACQPMPTESECLCCSEWDQVLPSMARVDLPDEEVACIATSEDLLVMLHPAVVEFFFRFDKINWKKRPMPSGPDGQLSLDQYRLVSYRVIMEWALKGETLGRGNRKPLPSCVVGVIRRRYPSESGAYVGFQEAEDAISML